MTSPSDLVRAAATRTPAITREILRLSTSGRLPRSIFEHWLGRQIARDIALETVPLTWCGMAFDVPLAAYDNYRQFEPETEMAFRRLLKPGMIVADVGANIGYTAALAARLVGPGGHVHAFEPAPRTLRLLQGNLARNGLANTTIHPFVAGDADRARVFHLSESSLTDSVAADAWAPTVSTIEVKERRLDDLLEGRLDFAKIDVEGAELAVLRGMQRILAQARGMTLIVEWNPIAMKAAGHAPMDLPHALAAAGYGAITTLDAAAPGTERPLEDAVARLSGENWSKRLFVNLVARRG